MTIDEAIRLLEAASQGWPLGNNEDYYKALDLGLEALKRVKRYKELKVGFYADLLPGETKE